VNAAKVALVAALAGGISIGAAMFAERLLGPRDAPPAGLAAGASQLQTLPDFRLPDLGGREVASSAWAGKVVVINYWASWCPPCLAEMPMLIRAQEALRDQGVQIVGIAVDRAQDVAAFLERYPVNYPILIGDLASVELSRRLGNRLQGLPFTVVFDARGRRVFSRVGELTEAELAERIAAALGTKGAASGGPAGDGQGFGTAPPEPPKSPS
jgi:thiol-disulfide isomerase/thioredoxin